MEDIVDSLNDNSGAVQAFLVLALVLATGYYAWKARDAAKHTERQAEASTKMAEEMREQAEASVRMAEEMREQAEASVKMARVTEASRLGAFQPRLIVRTGGGEHRDPPTVYTGAVNRGHGSAINVTMTIYHPRYTFVEKRTTEIAPSADWTEPLSSTSKGSSGGLPNSPVLLIADYEDIEGNCYQTSLELQMEEVEVKGQGRLRFRGPSRERFPKELANDS